MAGIFGSSAEDRHFQDLLNKHLSEPTDQEVRDKEQYIADLAFDKFLALACFTAYRHSPESKYQNLADAASNIKDAEWVEIARAMIAGDDALVGKLLKVAVKQYLKLEAEAEIDG